MASVELDHDEFDNDSRWPRRLLHVPTMTSYNWSPGNTYGGQKCPRYVAISYTWGRYAINSAHEKPEVGALPIKGIHWEVPRIDPATHFGVDEFRHICRETTKTPDKYYEFDNERSLRRPNSLGFAMRPVLRFLERRITAYDFLWLDVACIDQRDSPTQRSEIGRQARIFQGASTSYVWLSHTPHEELVSILSGFDEGTSELQREPFHSSGAATFDAGRGREMVIKSLERLTADPWFKSLWTLQEGYLCNHAIIFSREGRVCCDATKVAPACLSLNYIFKRAWDVVVWSDRTRTSRKHPRFIHLLDLIYSTGLGALWSNNPMGLLGVSYNRNPTREHDRVYGIMQVLGSNFRVGKAANPQLTDDDYTLEKLEDEFGVAVLEAYPILSQMHIYLQPPPAGKGWRIQGSSVVPWMVERGDMFGWDSGARLYTNIQITPQKLCTLSTRKIGEVLWGHFVGQACPFTVLQTAWHNADGSPEHAAHLRQSQWRMHGSTTPSVHMLALDRGTHLWPVPEHLGAVSVLNTHQDNRQHELASWVAARADEPKLWVSLLGKCTFNGEEFNTGLVMFEREECGLRHWRRVGICVWLYSHVKGNDSVDGPEKVLAGESAQWQHMEQIFG